MNPSTGVKKQSAGKQETGSPAGLLALRDSTDIVSKYTAHSTSPAHDSQSGSYKAWYKIHLLLKPFLIPEMTAY